MFEDVGVVHVGDQVLRSLAELVNLLRLSHILNKRFLRFSNFSINLLTLFLRIAFCGSTAERGTPVILWSTVQLQVSP